MKTKKRIAWLLSFLMIFSIMFGNVNLEAAADNAGLRIDIENRDSAAGTVTYTFLDSADQILGSAAVSASTTTNIPFPTGTAKVNIKLTPQAGCQVGNYGVFFNGSPVSGTSKDNAVSAAGDTIVIEDATKEYQVQAEFVTDSGSVGGPSPAPTNAISFRLEGSALDQVTVEYSIDGVSWTSITQNTTLDAAVSSAQIKVTYDSSSVTAQTNITSNGVLQSGTAYSVTEKQEYLIQADKLQYTVTWAYDDRFGSDGKVEHGKVEIVSAIAPGETENWSGIEPAVLPGENNNSQDENGGRVAIIPGSTVTVKIVPDYGYQFVAGSLNGIAITPGTEVSSFTFIMQSSQLHLSALFTASEDKIISSANGVTGAKIEGGENVIASGNLELTVTDSAIGDADKEALKSSDAAAGVTVSQWLEVDLMQIVNQGNTTDVWTTDLEELPSKITVTLNVGTGLDASKQYVVVREHKGVYEQIPATYDQAAGTLTFESDKFSGYAVGTVQAGQEVVDSGNTNNSNSNTNISSGNQDNASTSSQPTSAPTENKVEKVSVAVEYTVLKGDNLGRIARKHNMTLSALLALNPQIKNPNRIYPGQKIIVGYTEKTVGSQTAAIENAEYYTVQRGDSLYKIARKNGLTLAQLAELNPGLMTQKYIYAGQKIRVK